MDKVVYEVVEHDGGWAYRVGDVLSETFPSHDLARKAAERAAGEQRVAGETTEIEYEDGRGEWRGELSRGRDRPDTDVEG
ncbi:MAG: DUF2188 domain-containing protein [Hyphomicrobiales bacterium]|nr:DUF2188 domain-containing protein [Hyphomicrobiales bacterium]